MEVLSRGHPFRAKGEDLGSSQWHSQKVGVFSKDYCCPRALQDSSDADTVEEEG